MSYEQIHYVVLLSKSSYYKGYGFYLITYLNNVLETNEEIHQT